MGGGGNSRVLYSYRAVIGKAGVQHAAAMIAESDTCELAPRH